MGYVVLEAMACERPVVASRTGGLPEAISDGINGLLFEVGDAAGLAKKLLALYRDPELRRRLGQQGCKDVGSRRSAGPISSAIGKSCIGKRRSLLEHLCFRAPSRR